MKTYKDLYRKITSFENLFRAANQSQRGKRMKKDVSGFNFQLENELIKLQDELKNQTYRPGAYRHFYVSDPKRRLISAAPYRDRVVHHAFCNIIEPIFDKTFIYHSYACRVGKGTHKALDVCQRFVGSNKYVLQCDISKYFSSIDHGILFSILAEKIKDEKVMRLVELIVKSVSGCQDVIPTERSEWRDLDSSVLRLRRITRNDKRGCGLTNRQTGKLNNRFTGKPENRLTGIPIGNLTSQFFANLYLNELDCFVKFDLREKYYIRYMDDFLIFSGNKEHLNGVREKISHFLENSLKLSLHPRKSIVFPVSLGVDFCGFRVFKYFRRIRKLNIKLFKKKVKKMQKNFSKREITTREVSDSIRAWVAHASHGNTYRLRTRIMESLVFVRRGL